MPGDNAGTAEDAGAGSSARGTKSTAFHMDSFDAKTTTWSRWVKRLETAMALFNADMSKQRQYLLHYMGSAAYNVLCDKLLPALPEESTYGVIVSTLEDHFNPKANEILENYRFHLRKQANDENCDDFLVALRLLAPRCNFGNYIDTALRNQFVFGLKNHTIQNRLLEKQQLTLDDAITTTTAYEIAEREGGELHQTTITNETVNKMVTKKEGEIAKRREWKRQGKTSKPKNARQCFRCGNPDHLANHCNYRDATCLFCKTKGHLRKMCMKENKKSVNVIEETAEGCASVYELLKIQSEETRSKISCTLNVNNKNIDFEIDTGSPVTIISLADAKQYFPHEKVNKTNIQLYSYCKTKLECLGYIAVTIKTKQIMKANMYIVRSDRQPLLGREWLRQIRLNWNAILRDQLVTGGTVNAMQINTEDALKSLVKKYAGVFANDMGKITNYQTRLYLKDGVTPKFVKARRVPFPLQDAVEREIQSQVEEGLLVKVDKSEWATPIVVVPKRDGAVRICGDYKVTVNPALIVDEHPLPTIDELFSSMAGGTKFSKIDLSKAYLQLEIYPDDRELLTLSTHKGLFQPTRMMFGIASAPAKWQRYMEQLLSDLQGVTVFLDDIKITAPDDHTHLQRIDEVLRRLNNNNMRVNLEKSEFLQDRIEYCGYEIDKNGIRKLKSKVEAIQNMKQPSSKDEVRAFLGLINYYGRFIPNLSEVVFPLNQLLHNNATFHFDAKCQNAFNEIKQLMQSDTILTHYNPKLPLVLAVDASPTGVGAVLSHVYEDGSERPLQFASQTPSKVQQRYSQVDREAYAIIFGVKKFYQYIYGRKFILVTDNKAISQIFSPEKGLPTLSATRMQHYAIYLQSFNYDIRVKKSSDNSNADAMSRLPTKSCETSKEEVDIIEMQIIENLPITMKELSQNTSNEPEVKKLLKCSKNGRKCDANDRFGVSQNEFTLQKGCLLRGIRVFIPKSLRAGVLRELHMGHFGIVRMKTLARAYCWWPQMDREIESLVSNCTYCQDVRPNPVKVPVHCWKTPSKVFERVHVDYAGPVLGKYLLVMVDAFSKYPFVRIVNNMTAEVTIRELRDIFATFGIPNILVSDHGTQFDSHQFQSFLKSNGVIHKQGAPYHPATNGQAERYVQTNKNKLKSAKCTVNTMPCELENILLAYRRAIHPTTNKSPAMLMFGRQIQSRLDLMLPQNAMGQMERTYTPKHFSVGERVAARDYMSQHKWQYGTVITKSGDLHYEIKLDDSRVWKRHIDQMRSVGDQVALQRATSKFQNVRSEMQPRRERTSEAAAEVNTNGPDAAPGERCERTSEAAAKVNTNVPDAVPAENTDAGVANDDLPLRRSNRVRNQPDRLQYG